MQGYCSNPGDYGSLDRGGYNRGAKQQKDQEYSQEQAIGISLTRHHPVGKEYGKEVEDEAEMENWTHSKKGLEHQPKKYAVGSRVPKKGFVLQAE